MSSWDDVIMLIRGGNVKGATESYIAALKIPPGDKQAIREATRTVEEAAEKYRARASQRRKQKGKTS